MRVRDKFIIQLIPKAQMRPRIVKVGGFSKMGKHPRQVEEEAWLATYLKNHAPESPVSSAVELQVVCYLPIPVSASKKKQGLMRDGVTPHTNKPDVDNLLKNLKDAMTRAQYWGDDRQVNEVGISKRYDDGKGPRWDVTWFYNLESGL